MVQQICFVDRREAAEQGARQLLVLKLRKGVGHRHGSVVMRLQMGLEPAAISKVAGANIAVVRCSCLESYQFPKATVFVVSLLYQFGLKTLKSVYKLD
jgi:hypothetical protein